MITAILNVYKRPHTLLQQIQNMEIGAKLIIKTIIWRIIATITTIMLGYITTGNFVVGLSIGAGEVVFKTLLHFLFEKVWSSKIK